MNFIRSTLILSLVASFALLTPAQAFQSGLEQYEGPSLNAKEMKAAVGYIESHVHMPEGAKPLSTYGRYYAQRHGIIYAVYAAHWKEDRFRLGTHIVSYDELPMVMDGGCNFIDVVYVLKIKTIGANCHGLA